MNPTRKSVLVAFVSVGMLLSQACAESPPPPPSGIPQGAPGKNPTVVISLPVVTPEVTPLPTRPPQSPTPIPPPPLPPTPATPVTLPTQPPKPQPPVVDPDSDKRRITGMGKPLAFQQGEPVAGSVITLSNGQSFQECSFYNGAPLDGIVISGVIYPGPGDRHVPPCS